MLSSCIDSILTCRNFSKFFERKIDPIMVKYLSYKKVVDEVTKFKWPSEDEYDSWKQKYLAGV